MSNTSTTLPAAPQKQAKTPRCLSKGQISDTATYRRHRDAKPPASAQRNESIVRSQQLTTQGDVDFLQHFHVSHRRTTNAVCREFSQIC